VSRPVVFLGPTLPGPEARAILEADYRAPAAQGDLAAVIPDRPPAIGLIDGRFGVSGPTVWHAEILQALQAGIPVYGAASLGALRAAELVRYGMIGIGRVFDLYRSGLLEDDDEVAVVHADQAHGFQPGSDAMINIRATLARAEAERIVSRSERLQLEAYAKRLHFADRTWRRLGVEFDRVDVKAEDARAMLRVMAGASERRAA
jgi:hypothetical protein